MAVTTPTMETVVTDAEEDPLSSRISLEISSAAELIALAALSSALPAESRAGPAALDTVSTAPSTQLPVAFAADSAALATVSAAPLTQLPVASTAGEAALAAAFAALDTALPAVFAADVTSLTTSAETTAAKTAMARQERKRVMLSGGVVVVVELFALGGKCENGGIGWVSAIALQASLLRWISAATVQQCWSPTWTKLSLWTPAHFLLDAHGLRHHYLFFSSV
ncbi:hypothetical protein L917_06717 [Phytophthora nicotianae]|uniref:Uncharacterized protein n=2 Tax=Phytophthora nicotianae TaxID=4792 RepID=V9F050_PHYNI|nr:hypothetical protein F443_11348 [Phytophthora nicotianae P1569]ETL42337.1 hypothetical protein L916_06850 [Phytophthora nicotianae]ETL95515.1 hypothetical protein L917_06717 [Phytophthora nicotianae]